MKKVIYALILVPVVASGLVFANRQIKKEKSEISTPKPSCAAGKEAAVKQWEATAGGIQFRKWEASPEGRKVLNAAGKLHDHVNAFTDMEAVVTSLSLPPGSRLGFGVMASINGVDYILNFDPEKSQLEQLQTLKVNDKITIRSRSVSYAPKYAYPIVRGDYAELNGKMIYKRTPRKGC